MGQPLFLRLQNNPSDYYTFATLIGLANCITWYLILPRLVLTHKQVSLLLRSCTTVGLSFCLNTAFRQPLPYESLPFSDGDGWYVYALSPAVLPAHAVVLPRLGLTWVVLWSAVFQFFEQNPRGAWGSVALVLVTSLLCCLMAAFVICTHSSYGVPMMLSVFVATSTFTPVTYTIAFAQALYERIWPVKEEFKQGTAHELGVELSDDEEEESCAHGGSCEANNLVELP
jgi:uncharacterized membrane protein